MRGHNSPLAARDGEPLERLRDGIIEDLSVVENLEEIGPVLLAALERTEKARGGKKFGFSTRTRTCGDARKQNGPGGCGG